MKFLERFLFYTLILTLFVLAYHLLSIPKSNVVPKPVAKFKDGDCILHNKDTTGKVDFLISSVEGEKYRLIIYDHTGLPAILLADAPPYALTNYIDKFFNKVSCNFSNSAYLKKIEVGSDPLRSMRILLMKQDLNIK